MKDGILTSIANRTGIRLLASEQEHGVDNIHDREKEFEDQQMDKAAKEKKKQPMNPAMILMATVLSHLKNHKLKAELPDDVGNTILVQASMAQVLMALSSLGWTHGPEEEVKGGLYCSGSAVTLEGPQSLRLLQTSLNKVLVCQAQDPASIPEPKPEQEKAAQYPREDLEYLEDPDETEDQPTAPPTR